MIGKWHFGWKGYHKTWSVCGVGDCDTLEFKMEKHQRPRCKDHCKLCVRIARRDSLFTTAGYSWFRREG